MEKQDAPPSFGIPRYFYSSPSTFSFSNRNFLLFYSVSLFHFLSYLLVCSFVIFASLNLLLSFILTFVSATVAFHHALPLPFMIVFNSHLFACIAQELRKCIQKRALCQNQIIPREFSATALIIRESLTIHE